MSGPLHYSKYLADAHRPAMDDANAIGLPQTVFYHPDYAFSNIHTISPILRDKKTNVHVTWLPDNYFVG
jgi:hypothetical protein